MNAPAFPLTIPHTAPGTAFAVDARGNVILYWSTRRAADATSVSLSPADDTEAPVRYHPVSEVSG